MARPTAAVVRRRHCCRREPRAVCQGAHFQSAASGCACACCESRTRCTSTWPAVRTRGACAASTYTWCGIRGRTLGTGNCARACEAR